MTPAEIAAEAKYAAVSLLLARDRAIAAKIEALRAERKAEEA